MKLQIVFKYTQYLLSVLYILMCYQCNVMPCTFYSVNWTISAFSCMSNDFYLNKPIQYNTIQKIQFTTFHFKISISTKALYCIFVLWQVQVRFYIWWFYQVDSPSSRAWIWHQNKKIDIYNGYMGFLFFTLFFTQRCRIRLKWFTHLTWNVFGMALIYICHFIPRREMGTW